MDPRGDIFEFGVAPDLKTSFWVKVLCFPASAHLGRIGECVDFYKNFSKERFYDGSSLLPREWACTCKTLFHMDLKTTSKGDPTPSRPVLGFETFELIEWRSKAMLTPALE